MHSLGHLAFFSLKVAVLNYYVHYNCYYICHLSGIKVYGLYYCTDLEILQSVAHLFTRIS